VRSDAGDEEQIAIGDRAVEERRLGRLLAILVNDSFCGLVTLCSGGYRYGRSRRSGGGNATSEEASSICLFYASF
jgi:hypothetical protein